MIGNVAQTPDKFECGRLTGVEADGEAVAVPVRRGSGGAPFSGVEDDCSVHPQEDPVSRGSAVQREIDESSGRSQINRCDPLFGSILQGVGGGLGSVDGPLSGLGLLRLSADDKKMIVIISVSIHEREDEGCIEVWIGGV